MKWGTLAEISESPHACNERVSENVDFKRGKREGQNAANVEFLEIFAPVSGRKNRTETRRPTIVPVMS